MNDFINKILVTEFSIDNLIALKNKSVGIHASQNSRFLNSAIFVGATRAGEELRRKYAARPGQTLLIRCDERGLVLTGTDEAGTRHAGYEWLYRLGCRWYTPYDWGEVIPRAKTLVWPSKQRLQSPRHWVGDGPRRRSNGKSRLKGGLP